MKVIFFMCLMTLPHATSAAETITYTYDAKGRVGSVVHTGTVNNGTNTTYSHDKVDNRVVVRITGAGR
ncbi:hypothetical protein BW41_00642 [Sphingomonas sp. RIT328]|nr:hypothetical protein BW41_00642 [Sphingomonas sp. RIT328]